MEKILKLYTYTEGGAEATPFPSSDNPIEIGSFDYNARRMGGAPTITATVMWETCLDDLWTDNVYAEFNGEKYYLKQTPTSSHNNQDARYEHNLSLISERVALDNVYFYDAVSGTPQGDDKPVSNSANVVFYGDIEEFAKRMNASLEYAKLLSWDEGVDEEGNAIKVANGYHVVIDPQVSSEAKQMSFDKQFFSNVLQEIYNTYELPYYFIGKEIHIGFSPTDVPSEIFRYGSDEALLSITKNNSNQKVVNRVTGIGGEGNIPYYYPNDTPKACKAAVSKGDFTVQVVDGDAFESKTRIGDVLTYLGSAPANVDTSFSVSTSGSFVKTNSWTIGKFEFVGEKGLAFRQKIGFVCTGLFTSDGKAFNGDDSVISHTIRMILLAEKKDSAVGDTIKDERKDIQSGGEVFFDVVIPDEYIGRNIILRFEYSIYDSGNTKVNRVSYITYGEGQIGWISEGWEDSLSSRQLGLATSGDLVFGDTITVEQGEYINPQKNLMPPIYKESKGAERFYNAINEEYHKEEGLSKYEFSNPYKVGNPLEQIVEFPDIKPTIKGAKNASGQPIDEFLEIAFDLNDNNEVDENGDYIHSHFFVKLPKLPFNLFDHAIENGEMTINMTGGSLGGCSFVIAVSEADSDGKQWNSVLVDNKGNLKRDKDGDVECGVKWEVEPQDKQNDTVNNEVWIALKKDTNYTTYARPTLDATAEDGSVKADVGGIPIEGKEGHYKPYEGSTFAITNILLPKPYIENAENRLKLAILDYMEKNNVEKFNFSIGFSRIFFAENPKMLELINENTRLQIEYDGKLYPLYVSSYSYKMEAGELLPEISVELSEDLTVSKSAIQNAISEVKGDLLNTFGNMDVLAQGIPYFLRKDVKDRAKKAIVFEEGLEVGEYNEGTLGSGARISVDENGNAHIEADFLKIRKKATFSSITVQEIKSVGGVVIVSPAAMTCSLVEELEDAFRCFFNTSDNEGGHVFNEFEVDDLARCQTFNVLGTKYYWRRVVGVGDNYIDLSKTDCDSESDIPQAGDNIVGLGNKTNIERQNAIIISAYGDNSPSIIQYSGIDDYDLSDSKVVTKLSPTENVFMGVVAMQAGSTTINDLGEYVEIGQFLDEKAEQAFDNLEVGGQNLLRNSGFTGDYLTRMLEDEAVLDAADSMINDEFVHWEKTNAEAQDSTTSASGKEVVLDNGSLSQAMYQPTIAGESYVLTFMAKGTTLTYAIGGETKTIALTEEWVKYTEKLSLAEAGSTFAISDATCTICELQLERGTTATSWSNSPWDNASDTARWQAYKYLNQAIEEGTTVTQGGLILSSVINLGKWEADANGKTKLTSVLAGMSGISTEATADPAFWAGGNMAEATATIAKYFNYPTAVREGELPFVVTHGGRIIANDAIIRGTIYAEDGEFTGALNARGLYIDCNKIIGAPEQGFLPTRPTGNVRMYIDNGEFVVEEVDNEGFMLNETRVGANRVIVRDNNNHSTSIMAGRIILENESGTKTIQ